MDVCDPSPVSAAEMQPAPRPHGLADIARPPLPVEASSHSLELRADEPALIQEVAKLEAECQVSKSLTARPIHSRGVTQEDFYNVYCSVVKSTNETASDLMAQASCHWNQDWFADKIELDRLGNCWLSF